MNKISHFPRRTLPELLAGVQLEPTGGLVAQVYELLWDLIVTLQLLPGQPLSENEVAEQLNASKTPVREALIRLQDNGLVDVVPKSGTYVAPIQINRFVESTFIRLRLECGAASRAALHHGDFAAIVRLEACLREQAAVLEREDYLRFFTLDEEFHRTIFAMAGLPGVWDAMKQTQAEMYRVRHLRRILEIRRTEHVLNSHRAIVKAIRAGNPTKAEQAMSMHLGTLDNKVDELSSHPQIVEFIEQFSNPRRRPRARADAANRPA